jgi:4'-phosphopantetheinyl transferase
VHVWRASLQVPETHLAQLYATLSADEQERASHFRFLRDQQRFVVARGWLRAILCRYSIPRSVRGMYLRLEAGQVRFRYNPHGKPELGAAEEANCASAGPEAVRSIRSPNPLTVPPPEHASQHGLQFNLAHSEDLALYAISSGRTVGIDVEQIRPGFADGTLAESFFAPREVAALRSLPPRDQERAFFACWTRKEAYLKARGEGLIMPLDAFEVSLLPGDTAALLQTPADPAEAARWSLCELAVGPEYAASLAVAGQGWSLQLWQDPGRL